MRERGRGNIARPSGSTEGMRTPQTLRSAVVHACGLLALAAAPAAAQTSASSTCIAIVLPVAQGVDGSATDVGTAVRERLTSYLSGPSMQVVPLDARLSSQVLQEARVKNCPHVLTTTVTLKRGGSGSGGGLLGRVLSGSATGAVWNMPGSGIAGAAARGAAVAGAQTVTQMASTTKAKDELRIEYGLMSIDGTPIVAPKTESAKAKSDGEDLLTPLTVRIAEAIGAAVTAK
jgi:hypothetical protein